MTAPMAVVKSGNGALSPWHSRDEVRELAARIKMVAPGTSKLSDNEAIALAQASLSHGLDVQNGELWMIPGRGLMIGVKGLRKKAHEQVRGNFWIDFREITNAEERHRLAIPDGALAYEAHLFDSENIRTYAETVERLMKAGIPWEAVKAMVGEKPYTVGLGVLGMGEQTKMQRAQCAMKRAEADALKRRFDVPFGVGVAEDGDPPQEWVVEGQPTSPTPQASSEIDYTDPRQAEAAIEAERQKQAGQSALWGND